jgi:anthranilate phosphoribosyltransferase
MTGFDELATTSRTRVIEVSGRGTEEWFVSPAELGLREASLEEVAGGSPEENAAGRPRRARRGGGGLRASSSCSTPPPRSTPAGSRPTLAAGLERAAEAIDSGAAATVLERLVAETARLGAA